MAVVVMVWLIYMVTTATIAVAFVVLTRFPLTAAVITMKPAIHTHCK